MSQSKTNIRGVGIIDAITFFAALAAIILSSLLSKQMWKAPLLEDPENHAHHYQRWSLAWFVFFAGTAPFLSILASSINLALCFRGAVNPIYLLVSTCTVLLAWILQAAFWTECNLVGISAEQYNGVCYIFQLKDHDRWLGLRVSMVLVAWVTTILYIVYMVFCGTAVHRLRKGEVTLDKKAEDGFSR